MNDYVFDQAWQKEHERLQGLEALYDGCSTRCLADLGVSGGWQCLEVGFGAGSIALWLADRVGDAGRVVALDLDPRFLDGHGRANLDIRKHNILDDLDDGPFDLVHARAVLEHIPDRQRALRQMVSAVRPGGWLMIEEADFGAVMGAATAHYLDPPDHAAEFERALSASAAVLAAAGGDGSFGGRLIGALKDAGLENIAGEVHAPIAPAGASFGSLTIERLAGPLVSTGLVTTGDLELLLAHNADQSRHQAAPFMVTAWGQRPVA